jgi:hypothetical protein
MKTLAILIALSFPASAMAHSPEPPPAAPAPPPPVVISLSGDVKPLPWHLQNVVAGKVVAW